jgi:hypothetical protein
LCCKIQPMIKEKCKIVKRPSLDDKMENAFVLWSEALVYSVHLFLLRSVPDIDIEIFSECVLYLRHRRALDSCSVCILQP